MKKRRVEKSEYCLDSVFVLFYFFFCFHFFFFCTNSVQYLLAFLVRKMHKLLTKCHVYVRAYVVWAKGEQEMEERKKHWVLITQDVLVPEMSKRGSILKKGELKRIGQYLRILACLSARAHHYDVRSCLFKHPRTASNYSLTLSLSRYYTTNRRRLCYCVVRK